MNILIDYLLNLFSGGTIKFYHIAGDRPFCFRYKAPFSAAWRVLG